MKIAEIKERLTAAGIAFDEGMSKTELMALLPKGSAEQDSGEEPAAEVAVPLAAAPVAASSAVAWDVFGRNGYIRTYSKEIHDENAEALANQFANKPSVAGRVVAKA